MTPPSGLVGRDDELELLLTYLRRPPGAPSVVVVEGPQGAGKSALVSAAIRTLLAEGPVEVVKAVGGAVDTRGGTGLLRQLGLDPVAGDTHDRGAGAVSQALATAWGHPTMVVVEEAHKVGPGTLAVLHEAVLTAVNRPVLVLVARPEPRIEIPDACRILVTGLSYETVADLVRSRYEVPGTAAARVTWQLSGGLPGDVLDLLAETPADVWASRHPVLPATRRHRRWLSEVRDRVGPESWLLLQAAAVLDGPAWLASASALAGVAPAAVDPLVDLGVVAVPGAGGRAPILFAHPMTALAVRELSGPGRVRELHRLAAEQADDPGLRLHHLVRAVVGADPALAGRLASHAASCAAAGEWGQAARAYADAARVADQVSDRARHLVEAVDAYVGAGDIPAAVDLVPELQSYPRSARIEATLGYLAILRGRERDARASLTRAWSVASRDAAVVDAAAGPADPAEGADRDARDAAVHRGEVRALICTRWVLHCLVSGDGQGLVEWADRSEETGGPGSVHAKEAAAIRGLGLAATGRWREAVDSFDRAHAVVSSTAQTQRVAMGRGWLDLMMDDPVSARSALEAAVTADFSHGSTRIVLWAQAWLARTLFVLGRWGESLDVTRRAAAAVESSGHEVLRPLVHWPAAVIHAYRGEFEEARRHLWAGSAAEHDYLAMWMPSAVAHAQVAESQADYSAVLRALAPVAVGRAADPAADPGFWPWRDMWANALVLTGRLDEAEAALRTAAEHAAARNRRSEIARVEIVRGRMSGAKGDVEAALAAFSRAEAHLAGLPMPVEHARLRFVHGQVLRRAGRRREADELIREARDAYGLLGAQTYIVRCQRELKASGIERTRAAGIGELTPQEAAVVDLVAAGRTNKEVAGELYISVKTVQYHLTRVYAKLGVRSRSELAAHVAAARAGKDTTDHPTSEGAS